jgi:hypothetical protein
MASLLTSEEPPNTRQATFSELKARFHGRASRPVVVEPSVPTGIGELDVMLGGGFPCGSLVTLEGRMSSGRWSIASRLLASVTQTGLGAVIDEGELYPPTLSQGGVRLDRLLVVRARTPLGIARAADILIRSRACRAIVMPAPPLRAAVWTRLAGLAHRTGAVLVVIASRPAAELGAAAGIRLGCSLEQLSISGSRGVWCTFAGFQFRAEVRKHKRAAPGMNVHVRAVIHTDGAPVRERAIDTPFIPAASRANA